MSANAGWFALGMVALAASSCGGGDGRLAGDELEWVTIPPGEFLMGCSPNDLECDTEGEHSEVPVHRATLRGFEMTRTEITQYQYWKVTGQTPRYHAKCGDCPVEYLARGHADASAFCEAIGGRLPSEAEWEYAARAGTTTRHYCGDDDACVDEIAWHRGNSFAGDGDWTLHPQPVGQKEPNAFGLFDMEGNIMEYTEDCSHDDYTGAPADGSAWVTGGDCTRHVFRGGSYNDSPWYLRSSRRFWDFEDTRGIADGIRCARDR